ATTFADSTVAPSTTYFYKIQAINKFGNSGLSTTSPVPSATTSAVPPAPPAPASFTATAISSSQITLNWNNSAGATGYQITRSIGDSSNYRLLTIIGTGITSFADTG